MSERPVDGYVVSLEDPRRSRVADIYALAREAAPDAEQGVTYAMPALVLGGGVARGNGSGSGNLPS